MKVAILGSGNGGCTAAADWSLSGHEVRLFDFEQFGANIAGINAQGGIDAVGAIQGFAKIAYAGHDLKKALEGAELAIVMAPAYAIKAFGAACKPYLKQEQMVVISPSSGGAIYFKQGMGLDLSDRTYAVAETSTLPYATRVLKPGKVEVYLKLKGGVYIAALPGEATERAYELFKMVYPSTRKAKSVLMTMLQTGNTIIHPSVTLLNAGRIESTKGDFFFYEDGATPAAGRLMEALDNEKLAISGKLDAGLIRDTKIKIDQAYNAVEDYETGYRTAPGFKGIRAQSNLNTRYMNEDVGYGLVFMSELGKQIGVPTPVMDAVILICSIVMKRDYRAEGALTPATLGIDKYSVPELKRIFNT
jgi:opine dehydrogenase